MLDENFISLAQTVWWLGITSLNDGEILKLTDYQQRGLNAFLKQPDEIINTYNLIETVIALFCRCETVDVHYRHSSVMSELVVNIDNCDG
jgi:hypothetical protein